MRGLFLDSQTHSHLQGHWLCPHTFVNTYTFCFSYFCQTRLHSSWQLGFPLCGRPVRSGTVCLLGAVCHVPQAVLCKWLVSGLWALLLVPVACWVLGTGRCSALSPFAAQPVGSTCPGRPAVAQAEPGPPCSGSLLSTQSRFGTHPSQVPLGSLPVPCSHTARHSRVWVLCSQFTPQGQTRSPALPLQTRPHS